MFILVGGKIGLLWTIALVILSAVAGSLLLRIQGFGAINRIRAELDAGRDPGRELAHGAMIMLAAVLLLIPGFVTDVFGLLLFIPPVRDAAWRFLKRRVVVAAHFRPASVAFAGPDVMPRRSISTPKTTAARPIPNRLGALARTTRAGRRDLPNIRGFPTPRKLVLVPHHASQRPISIRAVFARNKGTADGQERRAGKGRQRQQHAAEPQCARAVCEGPLLRKPWRTCFVARRANRPPASTSTSMSAPIRSRRRSSTSI